MYPYQKLLDAGIYKRRRQPLEVYTSYGNLTSREEIKK
jgi:hypothetical protein